MSYFSYLFKMLLKNKKNYLPLILMIIGIFGLYALNVTEGKVFDYQYNLEQNYIGLQEIEKLYLQDLQNEDYTEEDIEWIEGGLQDNTERLEWIEEGLVAIENEDWQTALQNSIKLTNRMLSVNEENGGGLFPDEQVRLFEQDIALYETLIDVDAKPETEGYERSGINFAYRVMYTLFPIFIILILSIYGTNIFLGSIKKDIDIERLFPEPYSILVLKKVIFSIVASFALYLLGIIISFGIGSVMEGIGTFEYPIFNTLSIEETEPIKQVIVKMLGIQMMVIVCVTLITGIVSFFTKNHLMTMLITIVVTIGFPLIIRVTDLFNNFLHLVPFTYFLSGEVVTGTLPSEKGNLSITFTNSILSLGVLALLSLSILLIYAHQKDMKRMIK